MGDGGWDLRPSVAVDVRGIEAGEGGDLPGDAGGLGEDDVRQLPVPHGQDIRDRAGLLRHPGDKEGRLAVPQRPGTQPPLLVQLRHGDGNARGRLRGKAIPLPVIVIGHALALLVGTEDHQLLKTVAVQVRVGVADIADAAQKLPRAAMAQRVDRQRLKPASPR